MVIIKKDKFKQQEESKNNQYIDWRMSMQPIITSMLIDFSDQKMAPQQRDYQKQVYSAIKLNLSNIQKYQITDKFTQCSNTKCNMILTDKDTGLVYDSEQIESNPSSFAKESVEQIRKNKLNKVLWICGFCDHNNIVNNVDIRFATNKTRVIERQKKPETQDPILLIVFDVSGSMEQTIDGFGDKEKDKVKDKNVNIDKIRETKIYEKIVADEKKQRQDLIKSQLPEGASVPKKDSYIDFLKKNKLLMGLTQYIIKKLNPSKKSTYLSNSKISEFCSSDNSKKQLPKLKTIGFVFFNSNVMLSLDQKTNKNKILICDSKQPSNHNKQGFLKQQIDFDSFQSLYKMGQKYGADYKTKINGFQFNTLHLREMSDYTNGQTALGPAIVTALGVVSRHGQGSSILVVTDGNANNGIFGQHQTYQQGYKLLKMRLQKLKCFMTILEFRKSIDKDKEKDKMKTQDLITGIDKFCQRYNDSIVRKINVSLNLKQTNKNSNWLDDVQKKMKLGLDRQNSYFSNQVNIKCQHPNISYSLSQNNLSNKLFNLKQPVHIVPVLKHCQLKQRDFLHSFMTQTVLKYENTQTGEQSICMSYIIQKFIKFSRIKQKQLKALDNQETFMNVLQYLHAQQTALELDNLPLGIIKQTFRKTLCMAPIYQKTLRFTHKNQDQDGYQMMRDIRKFQDPNNKQYIKMIKPINTTTTQPKQKQKQKNKQKKQKQSQSPLQKKKTLKNKNIDKKPQSSSLFGAIESHKQPQLQVNQQIQQKKQLSQKSQQILQNQASQVGQMNQVGQLHQQSPENHQIKLSTQKKMEQSINESYINEQDEDNQYYYM